MILEIIHRFPYNESLKIFAKELMACLMNLMHVDNEENAVICLKIIVDLHKNYTSLMEEFVQPFLDLVKEIYGNMPTAVASAFEDGQVSSAELSLKYLYLSSRTVAILMIWSTILVNHFGQLFW
jgi:transformation/transcription domain-associated protein